MHSEPNIPLEVVVHSMISSGVYELDADWAKRSAQLD